ncbi:hypothetical protein EYC98_12140 [Halieaceae bacterium IMCC14734]|uniref:DUF6644 domain-containing protein n=1 Tax=Candidatus Litorirhabdus singularis TaxID=2518993 RepID=A0ABT3TH19_9GAMM|nr:DUF6644 family protein [Candidatus Litorirhabdus singularis]MCX2981613.1 hypothetical protein [Candidatus Litorirhabdus singularis]
MSLLTAYTRTLMTVAVIAITTVFALSDLRIASWEALEAVFAWSETTVFGYIGKTWGAAFAIVEALHLVGLAVLGGAVIIGDGRLLGLWFTDYSCAEIQRGAQRGFFWGLMLLLGTGLFMACGVAMKIYYMPVFWYKMLALGTGILFAYCIRKPLLTTQPDQLNAWTLRLTGTASLMIWFTVAAAGRWIGFSG